jgi:hypothetical protein
MAPDDVSKRERILACRSHDRQDDNQMTYPEVTLWP